MQRLVMNTWHVCFSWLLYRSADNLPTFSQNREFIKILHHACWYHGIEFTSKSNQKTQKLFISKTSLIFPHSDGQRTVYQPNYSKKWKQTRRNNMKSDVNCNEETRASSFGYEAWKAWSTFNWDIFLIIVKWRKGESPFTIIKNISQSNMPSFSSLVP